MAKELRELGNRLVEKGFESPGKHLITHADDWEKLGHLPKSLEEDNTGQDKENNSDIKVEKIPTK